jgi:hypothetical protein
MPHVLNNGMKTYILLEYHRDITITKLGDKLVNAATRDRNQDIDTIISALEQMDPTTNNQYVEWLARQYIRGHFRLEDYPRINDVLFKFEKIKNKLEQRDINQYTFRSLEEVIDNEFNVELTTNSDETNVPGAKNLYNGPLGRLDIPKTEDAAKILGRGTKWCTAAEKNNMFHRYHIEGPLYVWCDKAGDKYQFHFPSTQFMDSRDKTIPHEKLTYFRTSHPVLSKLFKLEEKQFLKDAETAYRYARFGIESRFLEGEPVIATDVEFSLFYARDVVNGRWKEGEPIIKTKAYDSYLYAQYVVKGEWKEGEPIIATNSSAAFMYATNVVNKRFPEGEPTIMKSDFATSYKKFVDSLNS